MLQSYWKFMDPELTALLTRLVNTLQEPSPELKQLAAVAGQKGLFLKINHWTTVLKIFTNVIEMHQVQEWLLSDLNVKRWLDDVKQLADDVEEILAEISKQASAFKLMAQSQTTMGKRSSLKGLIPACFTSSNTDAIASFDDNLSSRIIDITSRLETLNTERQRLRLRVIFLSMQGQGPSSLLWPIYRRDKDEDKILVLRSAGSRTKTIYGRGEDINKILEIVLRDEVSDHANFSIIPIIGTAGVGKTTLTRLVYDDKAVEDFEPRAWVSLYEDSNFFRICKAILESITSKSCNLKDLNEVLVQLKEAIFGRKFLFVLDDVSMENYGLWETLKSSFMAGAPGSKIIVTTHKVDIEFPVNLNILPYRLEVLSDEACWSMLKMCAFGNENYSGLEWMRENFIDMCKGLPLAASILGGLISSTPEWGAEWKCALNTKIWDLVDDDKILPVLKLSYQHLPLWLQRCFVYCAILPDDYEFEEKELVLLWIANGLIGEAQEDEEMVCEQLEDRGSMIFQDLLKRSLFEHSSSRASKYRMHDIVKTMVRWIHGETNFRLEDVSGINEQPESVEKYKFELFYDVDNLRTFLPGLQCNDDSHQITDMLLSDLLPKFKRLRALSLEKHNITTLPYSVEGLRYLRYINLSNTMIRRLPDSICSLLILQTLLLRDCSRLAELPSNLRKLINLWHLDITGVNLLREMPTGMKELECLRTLLNFIVGKGVGSDLKDLENLKFIRELYISRLHNVTGSQDTKDFVLSDKKGLKVLVLEWGSQLDDTRDELVDENVLGNLQPHHNLRELTIRGYGSARFSSWVGDPTYSNLVVLTLERCEKCTVLPSLGWLGSLEHLTIKGMKGIRRIGSEIFGEDYSTAFRAVKSLVGIYCSTAFRPLKTLFGKECSAPFKSLKTLCFEDLPEWEHWDPVEHVEIFPLLHELSLVKCPKLRGEIDCFCFKLRIKECRQLEVSFPSLLPYCDPEVDGCKMQCGEKFDFVRYFDRLKRRRDYSWPSD